MESKIKKKEMKRMKENRERNREFLLYVIERKEKFSFFHINSFLCDELIILVAVIRNDFNYFINELSIDLICTAHIFIFQTITLVIIIIITISFEVVN